MYKVLVVEDESIIRKGLIRSIRWELLNCEVIGEAVNGQDGIEKIKELNPDIVVVDINMPIKTGFDMIKETSEYPYSAIVVSGYNEFEYAKRAIKYGVSEYLLKPVDHEEMNEAIKSAIKQIEMRRLYISELEAGKHQISISLINLVTETHSRLVNNMMEYVRKNYMNKILMEDLVNELECSTTLMNSKFKKETGYTFNDYLNRYRIDKSIDLMKNTNKPLYQIAIDCGFSDYKYYYIVFKKYLGSSPKDYAEVKE